MIAVLDYKAGNLTSVIKALDHLGYEGKITQSRKEVREAERIIFPGVGAAKKAMEELKLLELDEAIKEAFYEGKPILGICLGVQIILERSEEGNTECLGLVPGMTKTFPRPLYDKKGEGLKIPHMGWNSVKFIKEHPIFDGLEKGSEFYFVHSYYPMPSMEEIIVGITEYGLWFPSILAFKNLVAMQFHPEKSGRPGLRILENFCKWEP